MPPTVLFLIDWDDTILPTHFLRCANLLSGTITEMRDLPDPRTRMSAEIAQGLEALEAAACALILHACKFGKVVFVTNSSSQWISFTAGRFFPSLAPLLANFECHSARPAAVEQALAAQEGVAYVPSMGTEWKKTTFRKLAGNYEHFVSIGDGLAERCAVLSLNPRKSAKAVRLDPQPNLELMIDQLLVLKTCLCSLVEEHTYASGDVLLFSDASFQIVPENLENARRNVADGAETSAA